MLVGSITAKFDLQYMIRIYEQCEATSYLETCKVQKIVRRFVTALVTFWSALLTRMQLALRILGLQ